MKGILARGAMLVAVTALIMTASGCAISPVTGAVTVTSWDGFISNPDVAIESQGEACAHSIVGVVAFGDASIETAKRVGGITRVATVDHRTLNIFHFYGRYCTVVYGE